MVNGSVFRGGPGGVAVAVSGSGLRLPHMLPAAVLMVVHSSSQECLPRMYPLALQATDLEIELEVCCQLLQLLAQQRRFRLLGCQHALLQLLLLLRTAGRLACCSHGRHRRSRAAGGPVREGGGQRRAAVILQCTETGGAGGGGGMRDISAAVLRLPRCVWRPASSPSGSTHVPTHLEQRRQAANAGCRRGPLAACVQLRRSWRGHVREKSLGSVALGGQGLRASALAVPSSSL